MSPFPDVTCKSLKGGQSSRKGSIHNRQDGQEDRYKEEVKTPNLFRMVILTVSMSVVTWP